jgi:hypothetical protein
MHKTFRDFGGRIYILDEFSYFGISKSNAEKRKAMWKKNRFGTRCIKKANGKYIVYRGYHGDINQKMTLRCFYVGESIAVKLTVKEHQKLK